MTNDDKHFAEGHSAEQNKRANEAANAALERMAQTIIDEGLCMKCALGALSVAAFTNLLMKAEDEIESLELYAAVTNAAMDIVTKTMMAEFLGVRQPGVSFKQVKKTTRN